MVVVSREPDGRWYVTFQVDTGDPVPAAPTGVAIGIDLGVKKFAPLSTVELIPNPKHLERKIGNLARYQRQMTRKQSGLDARDCAFRDPAGNTIRIQQVS